MDLIQVDRMLAGKFDGKLMAGNQVDFDVLVVYIN